MLLSRPSEASTVEPGIDALIAAKERLSNTTDISQIWSYRGFLSSYRHLAGAGFATGNLKHGFETAYGLRVRGTSERIEPAMPEFNTSAIRQTLQQTHSADAVLWMPTSGDTRTFPAGSGTVLVAEQVFALVHQPERILQLGAAPLRWEKRMQATFSGTDIHAFATPDDGAWTALDKDDPALIRFRDARNPSTYRAAQGALANASRARHQAHLRSDRYFERILAFTGEGP